VRSEASIARTSIQSLRIRTSWVPIALVRGFLKL
jgi:hypothetical protein